MEVAMHVAFAAFHKINFHVTWNCTHIANAHTRPLIEKIIRDCGYTVPVICTPEELLGNYEDL